MSAVIRAALAAAANTHLGPKKVAPYYRASTKPGDGWVSLGRRDRDDTGFGFMDSWEIRVVLSQTISDAEKWIDVHADQLADALAGELIIMALVPVTLTLDTGTSPGLFIEGVRPH